MPLVAENHFISIQHLQLQGESSGQIFVAFGPSIGLAIARSGDHCGSGEKSLIGPIRRGSTTFFGGAGKHIVHSIGSSSGFYSTSPVDAVGHGPYSASACRPSESKDHRIDLEGRRCLDERLFSDQPTPIERAH
jgi:hypothetical protein